MGAGTRIPIRVECYAGHRGEQTPRAFTLADRRIEVARVIDQWLAPDHRYFKVECPAGDLYMIRHDVGADEWELTMFQTARPAQGGFPATPDSQGSWHAI